MNLSLEKAKIKIVWRDFLIELAFFIQAVYYYINGSYFSSYINTGVFSKVAFVGTAAILVFLFLSQKKISAVYFLTIIVTSIVVALISFETNDVQTLVIILLFMINGNKLNEEKILRFCAILNFVLLTIVVLSSQIGIIENAYHYDPGYGMRQYLGFTFYIAPNILLFATMAFIAYKKSKIKIVQIALIAAANVFLYNRCNVRSSFWTLNIILLITLIMTIYTRVKNREIKLNRIARGICYSIFPIILIFTYTMPILYMKGYKIAEVLDNLSTNRIQLEAMAYKMYDVKLFGQVMNFNMWSSSSFNVNRSYFYIDSAFIKYLFMYGLLIMLIVYIGYFLYIKDLVRRNDVYCLLAIFGTLIHFITGSQLFSVAYNPFIIFLLSYTYMRGSRNETKI